MMEEVDLNFDPPYVGREEQFKKLEDAWKTHHIFGIFGVRAVGKSRFIKEFLQRNRQRLGLKEIINLIKVDMKMFETTTATLISLVYSSLGLMPDTHAIEIGKWKEHIVSELQKKLREIQVLVLWFDNTEDILDINREVHDQFLSLCVKLVQNCRGIKILVTSTTKFLFTQIRRVYCQLELKPLSKTESIQLLEEVAPGVKLGNYAGPIAEQCEGLPQLIIMAGSELSEDEGLQTPEELFELLLENRLRVLSREYYPEEDRVADVYSKFLKRLPEFLQKRLCDLNYIPGTFNATEAKEILGYDKVSRAKDEALIPIRRRFVLSYDAESGRFNIQGILRSCIDSYFKWANIPDVRKRYCKVFTKVMKEVCEEMGTMEYACALTRFSAEQPNLQKLLTEVIYCEEETYRYFIEVADSCSLLLERFFSKESEQFYRGCLDLAKKYGNTKDQAKVYISFGSLFTNVRGEFQEGEIQYRQAMDVLKCVDNSSDSQELALANQRMGWSLYRQGRYQESLGFLETSRRTIKSLGLESSSLTVVNLSSLGVVNNAMGNFERAKNYQFKTLKLRMKAQGNNHPAVGATYNNIGLIYSEIGNPEQALEFFKKGLELKINSKAILKSVVYSMNNVANQYCSLKKFDEAESMLQDALSRLLEDVNHSKDALSLTYDTLGKVYLAEKKYALADSVLEKAVEIRQEIMPNGIAFAESLMHLAQAKFGLDQFGSAILIVEKGLDLQGQCIESMPQNTIILESLELLANIYGAQKNIGKRAEVLKKQRTELIRLLDVFETKRCISKYEEMQRKHEACENLLRELGVSFLNNLNNVEKKSKKKDNKILKSSSSDAVLTVQFSEEDNGMYNGTDKIINNDLKELSNTTENQNSDKEIKTENIDWQSSVNGSEADIPNGDYFDNFCKHWHYKQDHDHSDKSPVSKSIETKLSVPDTEKRTSSFCSECGMESITDNMNISLEHNLVDAEITYVNGSEKCATPDRNESLSEVKNIPDFDTLLEVETDESDSKSGKFKERCLNEVNKGPKIFKCLCVNCMMVSEACRMTS